MLQKDLAEANRQTRRESYRTIALLVLLILLAAGGFWALPQLLSSGQQTLNQNDGQQQVTLPAPSASDSDQSDVLPVAPLPAAPASDDVNNEDLGPAPLASEPSTTGATITPLNPLDPPQAAPTPPAHAPSQPSLTSTEQAAAKATYLAAFADFTEELEPHVLTDDFARWNAAAYQDVLALKNKALESYGRNQLIDATQAIEEASNLAQVALSNRDKSFQAAFATALKALKEKDVKAAEQAWAEASAILPEGPGLTALKKKIDVFAPLQAQLDAARIAKTENKPQLEIDHLQAALRLDPDRPDLSSRVALLETQIKDQRYADAIQWGMDYVRAGKKEEAANKLKEAREIYPGKRAETDQLAVALINLSMKQAFEKRLAIAEKAEAEDNWQKARETYTEILKVIPGAAVAQQRLNQATEVLAAASQIQTQLSNAHRLSVPAARKTAEALIKEKEVYGVFSPGIKRDLAELQRQLDLYAQKVPLEILSDGKTFVSLRSIGKIGLVEKKTITLLPGKYRLEGKREGYKSKLISITLEPGTTPLQIQVICDEQL